MSCFDCIHSQPTGCSLNRPEFETYENCAAFEWENQGKDTSFPIMVQLGTKAWSGVPANWVDELRGNEIDMDISGSASSINVQKGDVDASNG